MNLTKQFADLQEMCSAGGNATGIEALVIGGGTSGIATAISLLKAGVRPVIIEQAGSFGGIWSLDRHMACYKGLVQNTAPNLTLLDASTTDRKNHYTYHEYASLIEDLYDKYQLDSLTFFNTRVSQCKRCDDSFSVEVVKTGSDKGEAGTDSLSLDVEHVIYAGGLYHKPYVPELPGLDSYRGEVYHSSDIDDFERFSDKHVLIVGLGNTGGDYANMVSEVAASTTVSVRGDTWVVPKSFQGLPIDEYIQTVCAKHEDYASQLVDNLYGEAVIKIGAPQTLDFTKARITVNSDIIGKYHRGLIHIVDEITDVQESTLCFSNGDSQSFDAIIFCTGYEMSLPVIDDVSFDEGLVANIASKQVRNLWFIGCPAVWGGSPPVAEAQGRLAAHAIANKIDIEQLESLVSTAPSYEHGEQLTSMGFQVVEFTGYINFVDYICSVEVFKERVYG
ncbi:flavin-containing monooxygenase [Pseudoalteromonas ardens]|uniref:Monooxygenase n=1 Tax=Pseudoalteromonas rubra TaxID=43658 RepID=A0A0L0ER29_9GAMM|nr:NAD(P)/FAD-dependent oxidoreductase [Pseudoalteromonas sp. R96]KNC66830.1 hypothetical protein AC626_14565 [Pseudoalteromonas rubra]MDK1309845.1 NAD(P)/FAD-dependent oxidoreductase [Pseudoalteromonas sp. R96]